MPLRSFAIELQKIEEEEEKGKKGREEEKEGWRKGGREQGRNRGREGGKEEELKAIHRITFSSAKDTKGFFIYFGEDS